jgi:hypothetical protein
MEETNDKDEQMPAQKNLLPGAQPVKFVLLFILQDKFNMDKSKLNWGLMSGIYPTV